MLELATPPPLGQHDENHPELSSALLEPLPAVFGREAEYTADGWPLHHRPTRRHTPELSFHTKSNFNGREAETGVTWLRPNPEASEDVPAALKLVETDQ